MKKRCLRFSFYLLPYFFFLFCTPQQTNAQNSNENDVQAAFYEFRHNVMSNLHARVYPELQNDPVFQELSSAIAQLETNDCRGCDHCFVSLAKMVDDFSNFVVGRRLASVKVQMAKYTGSQETVDLQKLHDMFQEDYRVGLARAIQEAIVDFNGWMAFNLLSLVFDPLTGEDDTVLFRAKVGTFCEYIFFDVMPEARQKLEDFELSDAALNLLLSESVDRRSYAAKRGSEVQFSAELDALQSINGASIQAPNDIIDQIVQFNAWTRLAAAAVGASRK